MGFVSFFVLYLEFDSDISAGNTQRNIPLMYAVSEQTIKRSRWQQQMALSIESHNSKRDIIASAIVCNSNTDDLSWASFTEVERLRLLSSTFLGVNDVFRWSL